MPDRDCVPPTRQPECSDLPANPPCAGRLQKSGHHLPRSSLGKAIDYALSNGVLLGVYLQDGRVEIDNNLVENAIRPTALGKKNWLFIGEAQAGQRGAILYTIIESCRRRGIDPYAYLRDVLTRLPHMTTKSRTSPNSPKPGPDNKPSLSKPHHKRRSLLPTTFMTHQNIVKRCHACRLQCLGGGAGNNHDRCLRCGVPFGISGHDKDIICTDSYASFFAENIAAIHWHITTANCHLQSSSRCPQITSSLRLSRVVDLIDVIKRPTDHTAISLLSEAIAQFVVEVGILFKQGVRSIIFSDPEIS